MERARRPAPLRVRLDRRRAGWWLAAVLALLGVLLGVRRLGWHRLTDAAGAAVEALSRAGQLALGLLDAGWPLLVAAAALALGLDLSWRQPRRWLRSRPGRWVASLLLAGGVLAVLVAVVAVLPPRFTAHRDFNTTAEELKAQNDVRATLLQALAGGVLLLGAYVTYRQLRVTREGQITDRYTKAVDQLGSEHLDVRVGGIYALERIARDSPPDRATIEEVLTAYVRDHAPWPPPPAAPSLQAIAARLVTFAQRRRRSGRPRRGADDAAGPAPVGRLGTEAAPPRPAADVRAAIAVLGRRELPPDGLRRLYLARLDLRGAFLLGANLQDADLTDANLQDANLSDANLQDANLGGVNLQRADLVRADIRGAWLDDADLQGADLTGANLRGANLRGVNLQGGFLADADLQRAGLRGAHLQGAVLADANLQGAGLGGAELQGARLLGADLQGAGLGGANLQGADLERANLQGARADEGTRWPDDWKRETAKARGVEYLD